MFTTVALALLLAVSPAYAGKNKPAPEPAPVAAAPAAAPAASAIDPAFEKDIRTLLAVTGAAAMGEQAMDQMIASLAPMAPNLPQAFWDDVRKEFNGEGLIELVVPIYARHLTRDDVKALITFYESPVGKKLVAAQPAIVAESMAAGQIWGQDVGMRVAAKMQAQAPQ